MNSKPTNQPPESIKPPFPDKMTFRKMYDTLFKRDFLTEEEFGTLCDAAEMYANGCLKNAAPPATVIQPSKPLGTEIKIRMAIHDIVNGLKHPMVAIDELIELFKAVYAASKSSAEEAIETQEQIWDDIDEIKEDQSPYAALIHIKAKYKLVNKQPKK